MKLLMRHGIIVFFSVFLMSSSPVVSAFTIIVIPPLDDIDIIPVQSPSALITDPTTLDTYIKSITSKLHGRVQNSLRGNNLGQGFSANNLGLVNNTGLNAGDTINGVGVWASYSYSDFENDFSVTAFDGRTHSVMIGIDFSPWKNSILGLAFSYEDNESDTTFNTGELETDGYTIAPYIGVLLSEHWSVDASFGYSKLENKQISTFLTAPTNSEYDSDRWFVAANINGFFAVNNWVLSNQIGIVWAENDQEQYTQSIGIPPVVFSRTILSRKNDLTQFLLGGELAYSVSQFEPFARITYVRDLDKTRLNISPTLLQPSNDKDDFQIATGFRMFSNNGFSGSFEYNKRLGRDDYDEDMVSFLLRMDL